MCVIVVGNKSDLIERRQVSHEDAQIMSAEHHVTFLEVRRFAAVALELHCGCFAEIVFLDVHVWLFIITLGIGTKQLQRSGDFRFAREVCHGQSDLRQCVFSIAELTRFIPCAQRCPCRPSCECSAMLHVREQLGGEEPERGMDLAEVAQVQQPQERRKRRCC